MRADDVRTFADLLRGRAAEQPDRLGYLFLADGEADEQPLTYAEADRRAAAVAAALRAAGARPGSRAVLILPPGLDYVTAFFGCLYAGVT
jgi:acyl-CoA synthetase (AMP-forming)/AMP-acid ligase II